MITFERWISRDVSLLLIVSLKNIFAQQVNRITARKRFEERIWCKEEIFSDYLHDKMILANHVPVGNSELIDYIIERMSDPLLRD